MKLEVGIYIRTKDGIIDKVIIDYNGHCASPNCECKHISCAKNYYDEDEIKKASNNIIDLIEVGDYVNDYYVSKIWKSGEITHYVDEKPIQRKEKQITIQAPSYGGIIHLHNEDIKSIVTKEQFENMEYRIG